jgi:V8-like Glu-specific endopeptidase
MYRNWNNHSIDQYTIPTCRSLVFGALVLGLTPVAATAQDRATTDKAWHTAALEQEKALGIERVSKGPDTYELLPPADLEVMDLKEENGLFWIYEGQETFTDLPDDSGSQLVWLEGERELPLMDQLHGSKAIDSYGRLWTLGGFDQSVVADRIATYDDEVSREFGLEAPSSEPAGELEKGGWAMFKPSTWYFTNCDADPADEIIRWGSDGRNLVSNPMSTRQKKVVIISCPGGTGSGVMVDDEWLLTAAHVITTSGGTFYNPSTYQISTLGNYQTGAQAFNADTAIMPGGYSGDGDINDDYAVVHLTSKPGVGWMAISQAGNSTIKNADGYNVGYPSFGPGCASTSVTAINSGEPSGAGYWSCGDVFKLTSKKIKTRIDSATGHSGGPFYYYPSGCCGSHYVTGVVSGWYSPSVGSDYVGGPKGPAIRSWVATYTP